jgi:hypothetical protein
MGGKAMRRAIATAAVAWALGLAGPARADTGFSIQGQIGAGQTTRDLSTNVNVVYGAILGLHFAGPLGLEADYQHAENDTTGGSGSGKLRQDAIFGHVRLEFASGLVLPFIYTGVGWAHYHSTAALFDTTADRVVIPGGVGLELNFAPLIVGARGEYQWNTQDIAGKRVDYWKAVATIGFRF